MFNTKPLILALAIASPFFAVNAQAADAKPSVVIVVVTDGDQLAMRFTPKCGCSGKSRPDGRITSIHGAPARLRA